MMGVGETTETFPGRTEATAFLVAGSLLAIYAILKGIAAFTETAHPTAENVVGPAGFVVGFIGLLALYPSLVERRPDSARAGAIAATIGAIGFTAVVVTSLGRLAGVLPPDPPGWYPILLGALLAGMLFGFAASSVASLRSGTHSPVVGLLLFGPPVIFAVMLSGVVHSIVADAVANFLISSGHAVVYLLIGTTLRAGGARAASNPRSVTRPSIE